MILLLYLACGVVPIVVVIRHSFGRDGITVGPVLTFSLGFLVYWIFPVALGMSGAFASQAGMDIWYGLFEKIAPRTLVTFGVSALASYLAFIAGFTRRRPPPRASVHDTSLDFAPVFLLPLFLVLLAAAAGFGIALRDRFFHGYLTEEVIGNGGVHGSFVGVSIAIFAAAMLRLAYRAQRRTIDVARYVTRDTFFLAYFVVGGLALSLGGRLYIISSLIMLAAYRSAFERPLAYRTFLIGGIGSVLLAGVVGVLRLGGQVTADTIMFNLAAEPMFTSFSLVNFLSDAHLPLLRFPVFLASDFANLIPTVIFPAKESLLLNPADAGFRVFAPLGALNSFFSFVINFGTLGTIVALYAIGAGLRRLRDRTDSAVARTGYAMLTGWLAFTFFRDPFSVSLVKNMFEFSLVMPALLAVLAHVFTVVATPPVAQTPEAGAS